MIYGRLQIHMETQRRFDYVGCLYPIGHISDQYNIFFDHTEISDILFRGYEPLEEKLLRQTLK